MKYGNRSDVNTFVAVNVLGKFSVIDLGNSAYNSVPSKNFEGGISVLWYNKIVLRKELREIPSLFREVSMPGLILCNSSFRSLCEKKGLNLTFWPISTMEGSKTENCY